MINRSLARVTILCVLLGTLLAACGGIVPPPEATSAPATIRVAVLPVMDALPLYVAQRQGYFSAHNIDLQLVPVASAPERDQLMQAGQIDAMINEITSTLFFNQHEVRVIIVRFARVPTPEHAQFRILASKDSGIQDVSGLKGAEIAVSDGTVIAYLTDRLLQAEGFAPGDIRTVAIPKISDRLAALANGTVPAATIPEPAASAAIAGGAVSILDDRAHPEYSGSVLSFSAEFVQTQPEAVRGFLAAWEQAAHDINSDKTKWDELLLSNQLVPAPLIGKYPLPDFPSASVPTEAQFRDVNEWAKQKGLLTEDVPYAGSVLGSEQ